MTGDDERAAMTGMEIAIGLSPVVAVAFTAWLTGWLNHRAHAAINTRISRVDEQISRVDERAEQRDSAHRTALESIARDVSFMAGRQTERDANRKT